MTIVSLLVILTGSVYGMTSIIITVGHLVCAYSKEAS